MHLNIPEKHAHMFILAHPLPDGGFLSFAGSSASGPQSLAPLENQEKLAASLLIGTNNWVDLAGSVPRCTPEAVKLLADTGARLSY
jgi:hypothetical protein